MNTFDVTIIGQGITGLSAAFHLNSAGFRNIAIVAPPPSPQNNTTLSSHYASVTLHDNASRFTHSLGSDLARAMIDLNRKGFSGLLAYVLNNKIQHRRGEVLRFANSDHEAHEMAIATAWLSSQGFPAQLKASDDFIIQRDGAASINFNASDVIDTLRHEVTHHYLPSTVIKIISHSHGIRLELDNRLKVHTEMVITACHQGIKTLLPDMGDVLVNHADQFVVFRSAKRIAKASPGDMLFARHSQFWASIKDDHHIIAGGAKFLRRWGGLEAKSAEVLPQASQAIAQEFEPILGGHQLYEINSGGLIDLRCCDERPLIGPMFGDSRILVASGYMGSGMTLGFAAGQGLAEFVTTGRSKIIPPYFYPARLRHLPDTD
jgi:glycine/D-amino acid oxidase-like deaminating enzyme